MIRPERILENNLTGKKGPGYDFQGNIKTDLEETTYEGVGLIQLAQDRSTGEFL
jgi:hypothetical protein